MATAIVEYLRDRLAAAVAAGFAATVIFTLVAYYLGILLAGFPLDIGAAMSSMLGDNAMLGAMWHYLAGSVAFPVGFLIVGIHIIPGPWWTKGALWGVILWLVAMIAVAPIMGAGLFMLSATGMAAPIVSLIAHLMYGVTLAGVLRATPGTSGAGARGRPMRS